MAVVEVRGWEGPGWQLCRYANHAAPARHDAGAVVCASSGRPAGWWAPGPRGKRAGQRPQAGAGPQLGAREQWGHLSSESGKPSKQGQGNGGEGRGTAGLPALPTSSAWLCRLRSGLACAWRVVWVRCGACCDVARLTSGVSRSRTRCPICRRTYLQPQPQQQRRQAQQRGCGLSWGWGRSRTYGNGRPSVCLTRASGCRQCCHCALPHRHTILPAGAGLKPSPPRRARPCFGP